MQRASLVSFAFPVQMSTKDRTASLSIPAGEIRTPELSPPRSVILGFDTTGVVGQFGISVAKVNEIQTGLSAPATRLCSHCYADACRVIDALPLHTAYELDKSFATACGDRKYFGSASGSRMSASDNEHSLTILRGAEILCIEKSVFDTIAE